MWNGRVPFCGRASMPTLNGEDVGTSSATLPMASRSAPLRAMADLHCGQIETSDAPVRNRTSPPQFGHCAARALKVGGYYGRKGTVIDNESTSGSLSRCVLVRGSRTRGDAVR